METQRIKDFMKDLTDWIIPGNTLCIYHKNKEVFRYSTGYSDLENKIPMNGTELMNIYSCSKPLTVVAAMQLYEKGKFLMSDPLYFYIPEFREMYVKKDGEIKKAEKTLTVGQLFTMTAGYNYDTKSKEILEAQKLSNGRMSNLDLARALAKTPLLFEPGTDWNYGLCHDILAALVEVISGMRFKDYVKENIFKPLEMNDSYYHLTPELEGRMAQQYWFKTGEIPNKAAEKIQPVEDKLSLMNNVGLKNTLVLGTEHDCGGAGIITCATDYVKFANCLQNGGKTPGGEQIIAKPTIDLIRKNHLTPEMEKVYLSTNNPGYSYGLGVRTMVDLMKGGSIGSIGEFGWGGMAGANILIDPEKELAFFYAQQIVIEQNDLYRIRLNNVVYSALDA